VPVDILDGLLQIGERARAISRGSKTETVVAVAATSDGTHCGHGECVPYPRYGESLDRVAAASTPGPRVTACCRPRIGRMGGTTTAA